jgi:hypothetical protein
LFSTTNFLVMHEYPSTMVGFFLADKYDMFAFTALWLFAGRNSVNFGNVLIIYGAYHTVTSLPIGPAPPTPYYILVGT